MRNTNLVIVGDTFSIKGRKFKVVRRIDNNNLKKHRYIIQSLFDNGQRFSKWADELNEILEQHKKENVRIFGKY